MPYSENKEEVFLPVLLLVIVAFFASPAWSQALDGAAFRLIGVIESGTFTGAVLGDSAGAQTFYRLREDLPDGSRIIKVESASIRIRRSDGSAYELFIVHDMTPTSASARLPVVSSTPPAAAAPATVPLSRNGSFDERGSRNRRSKLGGAGNGQQDNAGDAPASPGIRHQSPRSRQAHSDR